MVDGQDGQEYPLLAVDINCLDCDALILRTETNPGEEIKIPDHECEAT